MNPVIQQVIKLGTNGADSRRVLDALTPVNATAAPAVNATFLGQIFVDETAKKVYVAVAVGSVVKTADWQLLSPVV